MKIQKSQSGMLHIVSSLIIVFRIRQLLCLTMRKMGHALFQMSSKERRTQYLLELEMYIVCGYFLLSISVACLCIQVHCFQITVEVLEFSKEM